MSREKQRSHLNPKFWKIKLPIYLFLVMLLFGALSGINNSVWASLWNSLGHVVGETTFSSEVTEGLSPIRMLCLYLSRIAGLLLLPYAFFLLVHEQYRDVLSRWRIKHMFRKKGYVLVCGLGWKGCELAKNILKTGTHRVVGIDLQESDDQVEELCGLGMVFFKGDATSLDVLENAGVSGAEEIYVMTDNDELNCRIAMQIASALPDQQDKECYVSMENARQRAFLEEFAAKQKNGLHIHCFSLDEQAARNVVRDYGLVSSAEQNVHCVVAGNTAVAKAVLLQCLRMLHLYPNQKRVITVVCRRAEHCKRRLFNDFPCLNPDENSLEMAKAKEGIFPEIRFVELSSADSDWLEHDFALYDYIKPGWRTNLYMCVDSGIRSSALMDLVYERMGWLSRDGGELNRISYLNYPETGESLKYTEWKEFGDYSKSCTAEGIKRAACNPLAQDVLDVWGNRNDWLTEPCWSRESSRQAADHIYVKLALAGLTADSSRDEIQAVWGEMEKVETESGWMKPVVKCEGSKMQEFAEIEHRRWCAERLLGGWLPLCPECDDRSTWNRGIEDDAQGISKTDAVEYMKTLKKKLFRHGDLIPFDELLPCEKKKDYQIIAGICDMRASFDKRADDE